MDKITAEFSSAVDVSNAIGILEHDVELLKESVKKGVPFSEVSGVKRILEAFQSELYERLRTYESYGELMKSRTITMQDGNIVEADSVNTSSAI